MSRLASAVGALGALLLVASGASAQSTPPDRWDRARDASAMHDERVLEEASDLLEDASTQPDPRQRQQAAGEARSLLEQIGGSKARDQRVRYLYGHALHVLDDDSSVIAALAPLMRTAFAHPVGIYVMFDLAVAYARVEKFREEIDVYNRLLEAVDRQGLRYTILANRGESRAKLDDFAGAVEDFRKVLDAQPTNSLARWGLVVTLDRWGDLASALQEGGFAWDLDQGDRSVLDKSGVFFVPSYDKWWHHALRQLSASQRVQGVEEKMAHLQAADRYYELYLASAPSVERWVPLAKARRKMIAGRLEALRKAAPKRKARRDGGDGPE